MKINDTYRAGLYCRLSKDDDQGIESSSIATQRAILGFIGRIVSIHLAIFQYSTK